MWRCGLQSVLTGGMEGSKGKEKMSPKATRIIKNIMRKHFSSQFVREMKVGCIRKSSMAEI